MDIKSKFNLSSVISIITLCCFLSGLGIVLNYNIYKTSPLSNIIINFGFGLFVLAEIGFLFLLFKIIKTSKSVLIKILLSVVSVGIILHLLTMLMFAGMSG